MHYCWLKILNVVQVFSPAQAVTVCYCCYCCSVVSKQKMPKNPGKTRKYLGFSRYFRVLPALDAGDRRGSLPGLPYCCSAGLTLATVVGEPHCCSVVTVNTSNTVQLPTLNSSIFGSNLLQHSLTRCGLCLASCSYAAVMAGPLSSKYRGRPAQPLTILRRRKTSDDFPPLALRRLFLLTPLTSCKYGCCHYDEF